MSLEIVLTIVGMAVSCMITGGTVLWHTSKAHTQFREQIKTLFKSMSDKEKRDDDQDIEIKEVRRISTATDKKVAVIDERTKNMDSKLDQLLSRD